MTTPFTHPRCAARTAIVRNMFVTADALIGMDIDLVRNGSIAPTIVVGLDHSALAPFTDSDGKIDALLALEGHHADFVFNDFTTDGYIEWATLVAIEKVEVSA